MESRIRFKALLPLLVGLAASLSSAPVLNVETLRDGAPANFHKQMARNDLIHGPGCLQLKGGSQSTVGQSRRAKKRRYWRKPSSVADVSGAAADDGKADEIQVPRIKRDRKAVADGVQGVLVTTNAFAEAWRSRASSETIHVLSNAAQELLALPVTAAPASNNPSDLGQIGAEEKPARPSSLLGECGHLESGGDAVPEAGDCKRAKRMPSKYRRVAEQAALEFEQMSRGVAVINKQTRGSAEEGAKEQLCLSAMKVDLRGAVFVRLKNSSPPTQSPTNDYEEKVVEREWLSGAQITVGRHVCRMIPIERTCYASPEAAARLATTLLTRYFRETADESSETSSSNASDTQAASNRSRSFKIEVIRKCNTGATREDYIAPIAHVVCSLGAHHVNLTQPDVIVFVVLMRSACGMSVVSGPSYRRLFEFSLDQIRRACGKQQDKDELLTINKTRTATSSAEQQAVRGEGRMQVAEGVTICAASTRELQSPQTLQEDEDEDEDDDEVQPHRANNSTQETDKILEPGG